MVDGYIESWTNSIIPDDIIKLCFTFHDEVLYWKINVDANDDTIKTDRDEPDAVSHKLQDKDIDIKE